MTTTLTSNISPLFSGSYHLAEEVSRIIGGLRASLQRKKESNQ